MAQHSLLRLADAGLASLPATKLRDLESWNLEPGTWVKDRQGPILRFVTQLLPSGEEFSRTARTDGAALGALGTPPGGSAWMDLRLFKRDAERGPAVVCSSRPTGRPETT